MNSNDKFGVWMLVGFVFCILIVCVATNISEANKLEYRVEALKATQDCEPCQIIILTKGRT